MMPRSFMSVIAAALLGLVLSGCATTPTPTPTTVPRQQVCLGEQVVDRETGKSRCVTDEAELEMLRSEKAAHKQWLMEQQQPRVEAALEELSEAQKAFDARFAAWSQSRPSGSQSGIFDYFCSSSTSEQDRQLAANEILGIQPGVSNSSERGVRVEGGVSQETLKALREQCHKPR